jgi:hypothetical protein
LRRSFRGAYPKGEKEDENGAEKKGDGFHTDESKPESP